MFKAGQIATLAEQQRMETLMLVIQPSSEEQEELETLKRRKNKRQIQSFSQLQYHMMKKISNNIRPVII